MNSLAAERKEPRARSVAVTEESLTVDLVDGRTIIVPLACILVCGTARRRSAIALRFSEMGRTFTGPIWTRI